MHKYGHGIQKYIFAIFDYPVNSFTQNMNLFIANYLRFTFYKIYSLQCLKITAINIMKLVLFNSKK